MCIWSNLFDRFSDTQILWNQGGGGNGEIVTVLTSAWAHSNNKCLQVCPGGKEVAQDGDVDIVGNVTFAATRIQKVVTHGDEPMAAVGSNHCVGQDGESGIHQRFNLQDLLCLMAMTVWARGGGSDESHLDGRGQKFYRDVPITCLTQK